MLRIMMHAFRISHALRKGGRQSRTSDGALIVPLSHGCRNWAHDPPCTHACGPARRLEGCEGGRNCEGVMPARGGNVALGIEGFADGGLSGCGGLRTCPYCLVLTGSCCRAGMCAVSILIALSPERKQRVAR